MNNLPTPQNVEDEKAEMTAAEASLLSARWLFFTMRRALTNKQYRIWRKIQAGVFALDFAGVLWLVFAANLLGFKSSY